MKSFLDVFAYEYAISPTLRFDGVSTFDDRFILIVAGIKSEP